MIINYSNHSPPSLHLGDHYILSNATASPSFFEICQSPSNEGQEKRRIFHLQAKPSQPEQQQDIISFVIIQCCKRASAGGHAVGTYMPTGRGPSGSLFFLIYSNPKLASLTCSCDTGDVSWYREGSGNNGAE